jgi:rubrerythrin
MKNIKEALLTAITELDTDNPSDEDILRIGITAEQGAITLYNKLAKLTKNKNLQKILLDVSKEEKVHVHEFERMLIDVDDEELDAQVEGSNEVEEIINITEEFQLPKSNLVLEKGDRIKILGEK